MYFGPVFGLMALLNGIIQVAHIGPVADAGCANNHTFSPGRCGLWAMIVLSFYRRCFESPPPCETDPCETDPCESDPGSQLCLQCNACNACITALARYEVTTRIWSGVLAIVCMVYLGALLGYYRVRVMTLLNAPSVDEAPVACLVHAIPCVAPCALCQEARAAAAYSVANAVVPRQQ